MAAQVFPVGRLHHVDPYPRPQGYRKGASWTQHERRVHKVRLVIPVAGRQVGREGERRQACQRDVMGAADAGLEHPTDPRGEARGPGAFPELTPGAEATHPAGLDVQAREGPHLQSRFEGGRVRYRLIEADPELRIAGQTSVRPEGVLGERLLDLLYPVLRGPPPEGAGGGDRIGLIRVDP